MSKVHLNKAIKIEQSDSDKGPAKSPAVERGYTLGPP